MDRLMLYGLEWLNLYYGTYRAIVVDNTDDDNQGRLTVRVPAVDGPSTEVTRVAFPIVPVAGANFGIKSLPPVDGFVYVEFENGRPDIPLWKGGWWRLDEMPEDLKHVDAHGWFTPGGHQLLMTDESGNQTVRLRHSNGAEFIIDKDGNVEITNLDGKLVTVGAGSNEAGALGDTLKSLLDQTLTQIALITVPTGVGPSGTPLNSAAFSQIKSQLQSILSQTVKVAK
jgi:hypothetical protein